MTGPRVGFLACPTPALLEDFILRPGEMAAELVKEVSSHLSRCDACRDGAERHRQELESARRPTPWLWALLATLPLAGLSWMFLSWEMAALPPDRPDRPASSRPDPRLAALARFEEPAPFGGAMAPEDERQLAAARDLLSAGSPADAARLLEDLVSRQPAHEGLRLTLAYAWARAGDFELARRHYTIADELGAGPAACRGRVNASLRLGDLGGARRELAGHLVARDPGDAWARSLLGRINAPDPRRPRP